MIKKLPLAAMAALLGIASYGQVITTNFVASNDAAVWYRTGNESYNSAVTGSDVDMDVYCTSGLIGAYAYVQFNLSALGTNLTVVSATLEVTKVETNSVQVFAGTHSDSAAVITESRIAFYGLNNVAGNTPQDWSEGTLSFNATGNELTSSSATGTDPFNSAHGLTSSFNGLESINGGGTNVTIAGNELDAFVQSRIDDGGLVSFMIDFEAIESGRGFAFNTKESGVSNAMPVLTLHYTEDEVDPDAVILVDNGNTATLKNAEISAVISKSNGNITDLRKGNGLNLVGNGGRIYFDCNGSVDGGSGTYTGFTPETWSVITNTAQRVEVSLTDSNMLGCQVELHYILREGQSGLDFFAVWEHGAGDPEVSFGQSRIAIRNDPDLISMAYAGTDKTGQMIEPSVLVSSEQIMDATYKLPMTSSYTNETGHTHDGYPVYTKYDWSQFMENHHVHGVAGDQYGIWVVKGSVEYCNGGPTKAYQTVHGGSDTPVTLWLMQSTHKGASPINLAPDEVWSKLFGPFTLYVNEGDDVDALWADALTFADTEADAWPPNWMNHSGFPLERGTVEGQLHVLGHSASNALVVLSESGDYWHTVEGKGYQFWTRAAADGSFTIPKVRAGTYSLYAEVPGIVGIMERTNITVTANTTNDLDVVEWEPRRYERRLFRLGTPDLSTAEFRFGSAMRQYGLWWRYQEEQGTNDLDFVIGESHPATNWYYALSMLPVEVSPTNGIWVSPRWNIHFEMDEIPPSPARLSVDLAGAITGAFYVFVNGENICPNPEAGIYAVNDSGIYRSATEHSLLQRYELTFDPTLLSVGTNTISFTVRGTGNSAHPWSGEKPVRPAAGIMFDCIQLDAGAPVTNPAPRFMNIEHAEAGLRIKGQGGYPAASYVVQEKTNLTVADWKTVHTNVFDGFGTFAVTNPAGNNAGFFRLVIP